MPQPFTPHLEILPAAQRRLWDELDQIPPEFVLYGGTALALRLGHRQSVDFDFFGSRVLDPAGLAEVIPFLRKAEIVQRDRNTLTALGDLARLPDTIKNRLATAAREVDLDRLPDVRGEDNSGNEA